MEENLIFKSYLRKLLRDLTDIKHTIEDKEHVKATMMLDNLIKDTKEDIKG